MTKDLSHTVSIASGRHTVIREASQTTWPLVLSAESDGIDARAADAQVLLRVINGQGTPLQKCWSLECDGAVESFLLAVIDPIEHRPGLSKQQDEVSLGDVLLDVRLLYTRADFRRRGDASKLIGYAEREAKRLGLWGVRAPCGALFEGRGYEGAGAGTSLRPSSA
jgi:GNAT superfamily N-acetyltransferase